MFNNRRAWAAWAIIAAAVAVLVLATMSFIHAHVPTVAIQQKYSVPSTFAASAAFGQDTLVTTDSQKFITYNYVTGQFNTLSQATGVDSLKNIDTLSVSTDKHYLLFHLGQAPQNTALAGTLQTLGLSPSQDYWWIFNTQTKTFLPIADGPLLAKIDGNKVYGLVYDANGAYIHTYDINTAKETASVNIAPSSDFFVSNNGFLLETSGGDIALTKDGVVSTQLFHAMNLVGVTADKKWMLATKTVKASVTLVRVNLQTNAASTVASDLTGTPVWYNSNTLLFSTSDSQSTRNTNTTLDFFTYNVSTGKTTGLALGKNIAPAPGTTGTPISLVGPTTAVFSDSNSGYYIIGNNLHKISN